MGDARGELVRLVLAFTEAFNREDLDAVMDYFAEDAVYDEFDGKRSAGKAAIREAFVPQFRGDFGPIRFDVEECFADAESGHVVVTWRCRIDGKPGGWRGIDVIRVLEGKIHEKRTYAKSRAPLVER